MLMIWLECNAGLKSGQGPNDETLMDWEYWAILLSVTVADLKSSSHRSAIARECSMQMTSASLLPTIPYDTLIVY